MKIMDSLRIVFSILLVGGTVAACFTETDAVRFAQGSGVLPCPGGSLVAVQVKTGDWIVLDDAGREINRFGARSDPVWAEDDRGAVLVFQGRDGLMKIPAHGRGEAVPLIADVSARPMQRLADATRVLIAYTREGAVASFSILDLRDRSGKEPVRHAIEDPSASHLAASGNGDRVAFAIPAEDGFCLRVLRLDPESGAFGLERQIEHAQIARYFWAHSGQAIFYWNAMGSFDRFDLATGERYWLANTTFIPEAETPFELGIDHDDQWLVLETLDEYGFHQITRIITQTAEVSDITNGWIDHYSPVLSRDEHYLAYRQTRLSPEDDGEVTPSDENVYILDFRDGRGCLLCRRSFVPSRSHRGPAFSCEGRFVYFEKNGYIYQSKLKKL